MVNDEFFVPAEQDVRTQVGKPGSYYFAPVEQTVAEMAIETIKQVNENAYKAYKKMVDEGVAKELARTVLPMGMYTQFYWTVNARSLMNFLSLRLDKSAQIDIRRYATRVEVIFAQKMPTTYKAWVENGMVCP
jgi:thymidylate synthase (FAD)